ncbi:MAG: hypothetical protein M0Z31_08050 [Clostridia bacterium]|nr:hypothetical protein [Clostridia bacterium]
MKRYLVAFTMAVLFTMAVGVGIANALPTQLRDSNNTLVGVSVNLDAYSDTVGSGAEHKYQTRPTLATVSGVTYQSYGPHGKFTTDTNACGRCHQLHQAKSARLIRFDVSTNPNAKNTVYGICTYCHNFNGQSTYDVKDGMIWDAPNGMRYATNGGGFERQLVVEGPTGLATLVKANSSHQVNATRDDAVGGIDTRYLAPGGASNEHIALKCSSCHNPHGSKNARILVEKVVWFTDSTTTTGTSSRNTFGGGSLSEFVDNRFGDEVSKYTTKISDFCGACHTDYLNTVNNGSTQTNGAYRHMINMVKDNGLNNKSGGVGNDGTFGYEVGRLQLPLGADGATVTNPLTTATGFERVVCTTCHFAHGTGAEMTKDVVYGNARWEASTNVTTGTKYYLTTAVVNGVSNETIKNLRMDNRGVCQNCHNRNSVDQTNPALVDLINPTSDGSTTYNALVTAGNGGTKAKYEAAGGTHYVTIRFDQYMAKDPAEVTGNYTKSGAFTITGAKLQPDGRTVLLTLSSAPVVNTDTIAPNASVININGVAANAASVIIR